MPGGLREQLADTVAIFLRLCPLLQAEDKTVDEATLRCLLL